MRSEVSELITDKDRGSVNESRRHAAVHQFSLVMDIFKGKLGLVKDDLVRTIFFQD